MELTPERLSAQLAQEALRPIYLIAGTEPLRVMEAADAVRVHARSQGITDREVFEADARAFDWNLLESTLRAPGLFSARRLLDLRLPSGKPGKEGAELIARFCADPVPDVILLISCDDWSRQHGGKWSEAATRAGHLVVAWPVKPHELPDWIERRMRARGVRADRAAVQVLADRVEGNLLAAAQEVDKLALLGGDEVVDGPRMEALVADAARFDVFKLVDSAMNGQAAQVSRVLARLRAEGVAVPALLGMVVMELQRAATLAQVQERGGNLAAEFKTQRIWDSKQAAYRRALQRHRAERWNQFVAQAGRVDRAAKGRGDGDAWQLLERTLLAVAEPRALALVG